MYKQTWLVNTNKMVDFPLCYVSFSRCVSSMFQSGLDPKKKNVNPWQVKIKRVQVYTLPETKIYALKVDGWKMNFLVGWPIFKGLAVSFRECSFWGVPNECFGRFVTRKKDHQIQKPRNHFWARSKRQHATYKLDVGSNGKLRCTNLKSNIGTCKWWFSRGISSSSVYSLVTCLIVF